MGKDPTTPQDRTDGWTVTVDRNGERVVTIGSRELAGREISDEDARVIRIAARSLLSFAGKDHD